MGVASGQLWEAILLQLLTLARLWWKAALGIVLGAILAYPMGQWIGHREGVRDGKAIEQKAEAKRLDAARKAVARREVKADAITEKSAADLLKTRTVIQYRTRTLIQKVPEYVTPADDAACRLSAGFVRLYNASALGSEASLPEAAGGSDEAAAWLPPSEALPVLLENNGTALTWRAEAQAWRDWYKAQADAWTKR